MSFSGTHWPYVVTAVLGEMAGAPRAEHAFGEIDNPLATSEIARPYISLLC